MHHLLRKLYILIRSAFDREPLRYLIEPRIVDPGARGDLVKFLFRNRGLELQYRQGAEHFPAKQRRGQGLAARFLQRCQEARRPFPLFREVLRHRRT